MIYFLHVKKKYTTYHNKVTFSIIIYDKYDLSLFPSFSKKAQFGVISFDKEKICSIFCKKKVFLISLQILDTL